MTGYNYSAGMSNNAVAAYAAGVKPISRIGRADLDDAGVRIPVAFARWLARAGHWLATEWHHSGGTWFNRVDFYDPADLSELIRDGAIDLVALRTEWRGGGTSGEVRVRGIYSEFGGSRRRPRHLGDVSFTGRLRGDWIHLDGGGRKRADGNHITWTRTA